MTRYKITAGAEFPPLLLSCISPFSLLFDSHLVNQVLGTGIFLDDEEGVADIYAGGTLRGGTERNVARQAFVVAVEACTYQLPFGIEYR